MSFTSRVYHASAPCVAKSLTTAWFASFERKGWLHVSQKKIGMGTPHTRCREIHQSGRIATMLEMRSSPQLGSHLVLRTSSRAR